MEARTDIYYFYQSLGNGLGTQFAKHAQKNNNAYRKCVNERHFFLTLYRIRNLPAGSVNSVIIVQIITNLFGLDSMPHK